MILHIWDQFLGDFLYMTTSDIYSDILFAGLVFTYLIPFAIFAVQYMLPDKNKEGRERFGREVRCQRFWSQFLRLNHCNEDPYQIDWRYVKIKTGMIFLLAEDMPQLMF
jgi:hypothetical protein